MEFLSEIFIKFWKEVIVAVMLTAILPFIRAYVRRQRAKMLSFFREKERLKQSLLEEEKKRKEAEEEVERLRAALEQEQQAREEAEQKYQAELQEKDEIRRKAASVYDTLMQEQKAHKELEQKYQAEAEEKRRAQEEVKTLRISLEQERSARQEAEGLLREAEKQKNEQEVERNSIEAEFNRQYEKTQNEIKEKGGFMKFAEETFQDSKAIRYNKTTDGYCSSWTGGLLMPTHPFFDHDYNNDGYGIDRLMWSVEYLLASKHSKDEISQFSENALISFYNFAKEAFLAVGVHLVNCGKMTIDELRKGYCGNILDFREMIRNRTQDSQATASMYRSAYHRTTEILRKAIEAQKGNNNS